MARCALFTLLLALGGSSLACSSPTSPTDAGATPTDAGPWLDATTPPPPSDGGPTPTDAGEAADAGGGTDAGPPLPPRDLRCGDPVPEGAPLPPSGPTVSTGSVWIESSPAGASVRFDAREHAGPTPVEIGMVEPGGHDVLLSLEGHAPWRAHIEVVAGRRTALSATLRPERPTRATTRHRPRPPGRLSLNTRPWSKVYLGGRLIGTTPIGQVEVASGTLRLRLVDRDGQEHVRTVRVPPDEHRQAFFDLRAPEE